MGNIAFLSSPKKAPQISRMFEGLYSAIYCSAYIQLWIALNI